MWVTLWHLFTPFPSTLSRPNVCSIWEKVNGRDANNETSSLTVIRLRFTLVFFYTSKFNIKIYYCFQFNVSYFIIDPIYIDRVEWVYDWQVIEHEWKIKVFYLYIHPNVQRTCVCIQGAFLPFTLAHSLSLCTCSCWTYLAIRQLPFYTTSWSWLVDDSDFLGRDRHLKRLLRELL